MTEFMRREGRQAVSIIYAEATGSFIVLLPVAQQQGFFQKYGVEAQLISARGASYPV